MTRFVAVLCTGAFLAMAQDTAAPQDDKVEQQRPKHPGAGKDIGSGAGNIGVGAAKGAGDAAKGVGKGAVDLVTLHPVDAATEVGKGAAYTAKDVGVGTAKGGGKIVRGIGKAFKKIF